jgi:soluble lytic murein transglycosylase
MIDWIELIPFNETRNYVQRVLENAVIYRAQRHETGPPLLTGQGS